MATTQHKRHVNKRLTGVKSAEKIVDLGMLEATADNMVTEPSRWFFAVNADWKNRGITVRQEAIFVPNLRGRGGEILAMVDDYVLTLNTGQKTIVSDPKLKERLDAGDFSWYAG